MGFDPELFKQLIATFTVELDEQSQSMTDCLLKLEKNALSDEEHIKMIDTLFRAAHNIKGAARGIGINEVGDISHHIESLFSIIKKNSLVISSPIIDLCLEAIDAMRSITHDFSEKKPSSIDTSDLLNRLENIANIPADVKDTENTNKPKNNATNKPLTDINKNEIETIRVSLSNIERVSTLMEEILVNKIAIDDHYTELTKLSDKTKQFNQIWKKILFTLKKLPENEIGEILQKLFHLSTDYLTDIHTTTHQLQNNMRPRMNTLTILSNSLQEEVRMLRLVPVSSLLSQFPRLVRDLAKELHKEVELQMTGDQTKIDKIILEGLLDPFMHLLRNAIDHGIEDSQKRQTAGKPSAGHITIDIKEEGDHILIDITDDGAGIDIQKIIATALKKKLISTSELEVMSDLQKLELIFRPGFSTKDIITDISGRGVGLDVVKSNIENLKGHVSITTVPNQYTTFHLRLPLTLASERGLTIRSGGQLFVIPTTQVERVLTLKTNDIIDVESSQAITINGHSIPLRILSHVLNIEQTDMPNPNRLPIIIIKKGWQSLALLIDEIIGEREIVIKPLHAPLQSLPCIAGGTLSGSGQIIIVLNVNDLISRALHSSKNVRVTSEDEADLTTIKPHILVVDDSITTRTLEKNVLENKNYQVTVAVNGKEAWDLLQKQKFSLLITDVSMPIMDGFTLTEYVKKSDELRDMPVIIVTSLNSEAEKKRGIEVGANAYVVKSEFESSVLLEIVAQLV